MLLSYTIPTMNVLPPWNNICHCECTINYMLSCVGLNRPFLDYHGFLCFSVGYFIKNSELTFYNFFKA